MSIAAVQQILRERAVPLGRRLNLSKFADFADVVVFSFAFFNVVHLVVAPLLCSALWPDHYGKANRSTKKNWCIHVVSMAHSLMIVPLAIKYCLYNPDLEVDRAFGWSDEAGFVQAIACGYFLWDSVVSILDFTDIGFVLHAVSCLAIYTLAFQPFLAYYGPRFLLWEISTIFLNVHWYCDKTGQTGSSLQLVNGIILTSTFFAVRIVYGAIMSYGFFQTLDNVRNEITPSYVVVYGVGNVVLQGLNWIWLFRMIAALRKRFSGGQKDKLKGKDKTT